jgi:arsenate reductase
MLRGRRDDDLCLLTKKAMLDNTFNVLFICTGNSARSIMAEGLMNSLGDQRFKAYSAGSHPNGIVNALALQTLASLNIPTEGFRSKSWDEFAEPGAPIMDFVFTVCDSAAGEVCPVWPGQPMTAHWGVPDPGHVEGSDAAKQKAFLDVAITLKRRIELLMALPLTKLEPLAIQHEIKQIGTR